jgi:hypothetical protein
VEKLKTKLGQPLTLYVESDGSVTASLVRIVAVSDTTLEVAGFKGAAKSLLPIASLAPDSWRVLIAAEPADSRESLHSDLLYYAVARGKRDAAAGLVSKASPSSAPVAEWRVFGEPALGLLAAAALLPVTRAGFASPEARAAALGRLTTQGRDAVAALDLALAGRRGYADRVGELPDILIDVRAYCEDALAAPVVATLAWRAFKLAPADAVAALAAAQCYAAAGKPEAALAAAKAGFAANPHDRALWELQRK